MGTPQESNKAGVAYNGQNNLANNSQSNQKTSTNITTAKQQSPPTKSVKK